MTSRKLKNCCADKEEIVMAEQKEILKNAGTYLFDVYTVKRINMYKEAGLGSFIGAAKNYILPSLKWVGKQIGKGVSGAVAKVKQDYTTKLRPRIALYQTYSAANKAYNLVDRAVNPEERQGPSL